MLLLNRLLGFFSIDMGIDLGTANTLVSVRGEGIVLNEPTVVAVKKGTNKVLMNGMAVGQAAKDMLGKTPAGIGAGLPIEEPQACMVVDIGGGTTEIAVMSLADIVSSKSLRVAGDKLDDAIVQYMKKSHNLHIGPQTAEAIKIQIGSAYPLAEEKTLEVKGQDASTGLPRGCIVNSAEVREHALKEPVTRICAAIREVLERTPPELAADLVDSGLTLCGGGALLRGIDKVIEEAIGLPVRIADDPLACVAIGTGIYLEHLDTYASVLESSADGD